MYRLGFILLCLFIMFMEAIIGIMSVSAGFFATMFSAGIFLWVFMFVLGHFEMQMFAAMDDRTWFDWIFFILCTPSVLFTLLLAYFGKVTIEWASSYTPTEKTSSKNETYKVTTDLSGREIIVDSKGDKVTSVDFVNWDGGVYGTDGKKYDKKD